MTQKISRGILRDEVYKSLKDSILKNECLPGEELSIESLAEDLGVSATPVREALAKLNADGLIELPRNKKAKVTEITENDVRNTYEVRKVLEPYIASIAAKKVSKNELLNLKKKLERLPELDLRESYEAYHQTDLELNNLLWKTIENDLLRQVFSYVSDRTLRIRFFAETCEYPERKEIIGAGNDEHLQIVQALMKSDSNQVKEFVLVHLDNAEKRTLQAIEKTSGINKRTSTERRIS